MQYVDYLTLVVIWGGSFVYADSDDTKQRTCAS